MCKAIDHGAMGFIVKSSTPEILLQALRLVLAGGVYLPSGILAHENIEDDSKSEALHRLTSRQMDVLQCVVQGKPNKVIAQELYMSEATTKAHISSILQTLGAKNRTEAVFIAAKQGMKIN